MLYCIFVKAPATFSTWAGLARQYKTISTKRKMIKMLQCKPKTQNDDRWSYNLKKTFSHFVIISIWAFSLIVKIYLFPFGIIFQSVHVCELKHVCMVYFQLLIIFIDNSQLATYIITYISDTKHNRLNFRERDHAINSLISEPRIVLFSAQPWQVTGQLL